MLEVESVWLKGSESDLEFCWDIGFENSSFRVNVEHCHVLTVESLSFLIDPENIEFGLKFVGDFDLFLST